MNRSPRSGEFYRHFKDKLCQIITVAEHRETGEKMVVYQELYGDYKIYTSPLKQFADEADQERRFELVTIQAEAEVCEAGKACEAKEQEAPTVFHPLLMPFVESETYEQKLELLMAMWGKIGQAELEVLYEALDLPMRDGSVEEQFRSIENYLVMQQKFDGKRLR